MSPMPFLSEARAAVLKERPTQDQVLVALGVALYVLWESVLIAQSTGQEFTLFTSVVPLTPALMLAMAGGALLGCALQSPAALAERPAQTLSSATSLPALCGLGGAVLFPLTALFPEANTALLLAGTVLGGTLLPQVFAALARLSTLMAQAMALVCGHALGEAVAIMAEAGAAKAGLASPEDVASLLFLVLAGLALWQGRMGAEPAPQAHPAASRASPPSRTELYLLITAATLFFLLHASHDYLFRLYAYINEGPPIWLRLSLRLAFPLLALAAGLRGLTLLAVASVALSAFSPVMNLFEGDKGIYWAMYFLDSMGLHGGLFMFVLAFGRLAAGAKHSLLVRVLPSLCMYVTFAALWHINDTTTTDPDSMMLANVLCLCLLVVAMAQLSRRWLLAENTSEHGATALGADDAVQPPTPQMLAYAGTTFAAAHRLSPREVQVLELICEGLSYAQMAERLFIAENTIKIHVSNILKKTESRSRTQLMGKLFALTGQI